MQQQITKFTRPLSASGIKTFCECPAKFYRQYILRLPRYTSDALKFGRAIHVALEFLELKKMNDTSESKSISQEDISLCIAKFHESAVEEGLLTAALLKEGEEVLRKYFSNYDIDDKVVAVEKKFRLTTVDGIPITGAIDKLVEVSPDTVVVVDYKTSFFTQTPSDMEDDIQLSMYDLAVRQMYPQYKNVILMLDYLRKKPVVTYRDDEQRAKFEKFLVTIYNKIQALEESSAREQINPFCGWCDFKNVCNSYHRAFNKENNFPELAITPDFTESDAIRSLEILKANQAILESRKRELNYWITGRMADTETLIQNEDKVVDITQQSRVKYDIKAVYDAIPLEKFLEVATVNKTSLERFLASEPRYQAPIERAVQVNYGNFFPQIKSKSDKKTKPSGKKSD